MPFIRNGIQMKLLHSKDGIRFKLLHLQDGIRTFLLARDEIGQSHIILGFYKTKMINFMRKIKLLINTNSIFI